MNAAASKIRGIDPIAVLSVLRDGSLVERRAHAPRQLQGVVIGPEVDEEHAGLLVEHMAVDRGHLDVALWI